MRKTREKDLDLSDWQSMKSKKDSERSRSLSRRHIDLESRDKQLKRRIFSDNSRDSTKKREKEKDLRSKLKKRLSNSLPD